MRIHFYCNLFTQYKYIVINKYIIYFFKQYTIRCLFDGRLSHVNVVNDKCDVIVVNSMVIMTQTREPAWFGHSFYIVYMYVTNVTQRYIHCTVCLNKYFQIIQAEIPHN